MKARTTSPVMIFPQAMQALQALGKAADQGGVPRATTDLVLLRASQINGCSVCVDMHAETHVRLRSLVTFSRCVSS